MLNKTSKAFSIVELMITLVVMSLVIAAFTPVITKKLKAKTASGSIENVGDMSDEEIAELKAKTADMFMPFDAVAGKTQTNSDGSYFKCNSIVTNSTTKARTTTCKVKIPSDHVSIVMVGAGGGGNGGCSSSFGASTSTMAQLESGKPRHVRVTSDMKKVIVNNLGDDCKSISGAWLHKIDHETEVEYIKECPVGTSEIVTGSGSRFCITNYNVRPASYDDYHYNYPATKTKLAESAAMAKEIKVDFSGLLTDSSSDAEYSYILANKTPVCWVSGSGSCSGNSGDYPNCSRTVCNWHAANLMCPQVDLGGNNCSDDGVHFDRPCKGRWHLMTFDELSYYTDASGGTTMSSSYFGSQSFLFSVCGHIFNALYPENIKSKESFCRGNTSSGGCYKTQVCEGSSDTSCTPYETWGASLSSNIAFTYSLPPNTAWSHYISRLYKERAASVRCIMQKSKGSPLHTFVKGGEGGGSAKVANFTIPQSFIEKCTASNSCILSEGNITYENRKAFAHIIRGGFNITDKGEAHPDRSILLTDETKNKTIWGYKVETGESGNPALLDSETGQATIGAGGKGGKLCYEYTEENGWSTGFDCEGENRGLGSHGINGEDGEIVKYKEKVDGDIYMPLGSASYGIWQKLAGQDFYYKTPYFDYQTYGYCNAKDVSVKYYRVKYDGAGSGGGGGAFAHIKDIPITPNKEYTIVIGGGGLISGSNGTPSYGGCYSYISNNGGDTIIYLDDNTVLTAHGGKVSSTVATRATTTTDGIHAGIGTGGTFEAVSDSEIINTILNSKAAISANGGNGQKGKYGDNFDSIGGNGGVSGISIATQIIKNSVSCGGLNSDANFNCNNQNNRHGVPRATITALHAPVKHIYLDGNYGSYGAGGAGGASKYDDSVGGHIPGAGSAGQDGYVYFYWNKQ